MKESAKTKNLQKLEGVVVSNKMKDTIVIRVDRYVQHPKYKKFYTKSSKFMAHDPGNTKEIGEKVIIVATKPISKNKRFRLI